MGNSQQHQTLHFSNVTKWRHTDHNNEENESNETDWLVIALSSSVSGQNEAYEMSIGGPDDSRRRPDLCQGLPCCQPLLRSCFEHSQPKAVAKASVSACCRFELCSCLGQSALLALWFARLMRTAALRPV